MHNLVIGNNVQALAAAAPQGRELGFAVLNLGSYLEGETRQLAIGMAGIVRSIVEQGDPGQAAGLPAQRRRNDGDAPPTRQRRPQSGIRAGLSPEAWRRSMRNIVILSGGTDGEDGPTDAAGAIGTGQTLIRAADLGLDPTQFLDRHDAYSLFEKTGDLLRTGLTETNVMDVRVILIADNVHV